MKNYITPSFELQVISSKDIMTSSGNVDVLFGGYSNVADYVGDSLDFSDFQ